MAIAISTLYVMCTYLYSHMYQFLPIGGTWAEMMTYLVLNGADIEEANSQSLHLRSKFLELKRLDEGLCGAEMAKNDPSPRMLKSHLQEHVLHKSVMEGKPKVIVVMRNPKDQLVSFYHFHKNLPVLGFPGTWNEFFELYKKKELYYGDIFDFDVGWWKHRDEENVLFLKFEDMKRDLNSTVQQIAQHCQVQLSPSQVGRIVAQGDFQAMKSCGAVRRSVESVGMTLEDFLRKGEVGDWRNYFTPEQSAYVDAQCVERLNPVGLQFAYD